MFGLQLSLARLGSTVCFLVLEPVCRLLTGVTARPLGFTLLAAAALPALSLAASAILAAIPLPKPEEVDNNNEPEQEVGSGRGEAKRLPLAFWLLCLLTLAYYGVTFSFVSLGQGLFRNKFGCGEAESNFLVGKFFRKTKEAKLLFGKNSDIFPACWQKKSSAVLCRTCVPDLCHCLACSGVADRQTGPRPGLGGGQSDRQRGGARSVGVRTRRTARPARHPARPRLLRPRLRALDRPGRPRHLRPPRHRFRNHAVSSGET